MKILPTQPKSKEWLKERRKYLGASESAAALNVDPHKTATDVYLDKIGEGTPFEGNAFTERGLVLEPAVCLAYATQNGVTLGPEFFARHSEEDWMAATPDASIEGKKKHLQVKTHNNWVRDDYAPSGVPDGFPLHESIQVTHELAVTENDEADLVVLFGEESELQLLADIMKTGLITQVELARYILDKMDFRTYTIERDLKVERDLIDSLRPFWFDCVLKREYPAASPYRQDNGMIIQATPEEAMLVADLKRAMLYQFVASQEVDRVKGEIQGLLGARAGIYTKLGKVTWKKCKDSKKEITDWEKVAKEAIEENLYESGDKAPDDIVQAHTTPMVDWEKVCKDLKVDPRLIGKFSKDVVTRKGSRRFMPPTKQWNQEFMERKMSPKELTLNGARS